MTAASPLARYGAIENALTSGFATADLHHSAGHDPNGRRTGGCLAEHEPSNRSMPIGA
ncbi:hypothetical protein FHX16_003273 [Rhizobium sp. BK661]|nr:hypothetical protein [Rhizobium sp. BK661]